MRRAFGLGILFIQFFIPFFVLIICYGKIVWVLTRRINTDLMKPKSAMSKSEHFSNSAVNEAKTSPQVTDTGKDMFQLARRNTL